MSSRPASPPPIARWPFFAGASILFAVAAYLLLVAGRPPAIAPLVVAIFLTGASILVSVIPFIVENERRLRLAEAAVREGAEAQLRRLAQTADQLTHVVSRSQSTEEQAGRALGTLEEVAERMVTQAEELAAALSRAGEREQTARSDELQRLIDDRDQKFTALEIRLNATSVSLSETQVAIKKAATGQNRAIEALASRLEEVADELKAALAAVAGRVAAAPPDEMPAIPHEHGILDTGSVHFEAEHPTTLVAHPVDADEVGAPTSPPPSPLPQITSAPPPEDPVVTAVEPVPAPPTPSAEVEAAAPDSAAPVDTTGESTTETTPPAARSRRARAHRIVEKPAEEPSERETPPPAEEETPPARPTAPLELALEGMPEPRPVMRLNRREPAGSTSLVATAYIGIGNKLYLRGDGPGLSWERGVPMQFLAIGKWGWTTTDASVPVTCRVYRNDDTPMLEENVVIDPGTKAEITPKF